MHKDTHLSVCVCTKKLRGTEATWRTPTYNESELQRKKIFKNSGEAIAKEKAVLVIFRN